ncbi:MAG: NAD(P)H-hydrate dehydratase, partial [Clostridioides sp.]|nr:NAD(P)H-hydrate dehydratase [Clostridioides sp.]
DKKLSINEKISSDYKIDVNKKINTIEKIDPSVKLDVSTKSDLDIKYIDKDFVSKILKPRKQDAYKKDFGHAFIISGSVGFSGAAYLVAQSCVRSGAGLVTLCTPREIQDIMSIKLSEAMTLNFDEKEKIDEFLEKADSIGIGPGMTNSQRTLEILNNVIEKVKCPIIVDADGINVLQGNLDLLIKRNKYVNLNKINQSNKIVSKLNKVNQSNKIASKLNNINQPNKIVSKLNNINEPNEITSKIDNENLRNKISLRDKRKKIILTPHYGEMSRITGISIPEIKKNRVEISKEFAKKYNVILLLKDHRTLVTDGENVFINTSGNSSMASGGMGDTLTGIITSFVAQGYSEIDATCVGVFLHGYCGDKLSEKMFCVNATHIIDELPFAIKDLMR